MEQWLITANNHSATQEIHHLSQDWKIHYSPQNSLLTQYLYVWNNKG